METERWKQEHCAGEGAYAIGPTTEGQMAVLGPAPCLESLALQPELGSGVGLLAAVGGGEGLGLLAWACLPGLACLGLLAWACLGLGGRWSECAACCLLA